ncbi:MAG TPA: MFS transporter, partial [Longimicrobium sp.]|nr:MFS transporter [Longimicrobium sp.]
AGFASVIFVPLATWLVQAHGWRDALLWLAAILAAATVVPHALLLRRDPWVLGLQPDGGITGDDGGVRAPPIVPGIPADRAIRSASFHWLTAAFALSALTTTALAVHLIPLLLERGYSPAFAGAALGALGLMALPGRLVFTPLGSRWPRPAVTAAIFLLGALGIAALLVRGGEGWVWACVALFGAGFGAITPARAALVAEMYGPLEYGRINGVLAMWLAVARAAAPVGASVLYTWGGGYTPVLWTLMAACLAAAAAVLLAGTPPVRSPVPVRP